MGDIIKLGEGGRELLLMRELGGWISRQSPPLTDRAENRREMCVKERKVNVMEMAEEML